jgi:SAM-dependent methyltransferase
MNDQRIRANCPACQSIPTRFQWGVISPFLAKRAFFEAPGTVKIHSCSRCGMRWCERGITQDEVERLYSGYRLEEYFVQRNAFEPWYTKSVNDGIGSSTTMIDRRQELLNVLNANGIEVDQFRNVIDHGGDRGQMLADFKNANKFVFDLSLVDLDAGIQRLEKLESGYGKFDLALNCMVLEHMSNPLDGLKETVSLVKPGGFVYIEVPNEMWRGPQQSFFQEKMLNFICKHPSILMLTDFLCTASRITTNWVIPFGFVAIREHINYFTPGSLQSLMRSSGVNEVTCITKGGVLMALGKRES